MRKNTEKMKFLGMKTWHVGEQKHWENEVFENENVDINVDLASQVCQNLKIAHKTTSSFMCVVTLFSNFFSLHL